VCVCVGGCGASLISDMPNIMVILTCKT